MAANAKVAEIYVELTAKTAQFKAALNEATNESRKFATEMRQQTHEARGALVLLGDEIGVRLPRELRNLVAENQAVARAINAAFSTIAIVGFINVAVEAGRKIYEFIQKNEEAAKKNSETWARAAKDLESINSALAVSDSRIEDTINKLERKPSNGIATALLEASEAAEKLGEKLDEDLKKLSDVKEKSGLSSLFFGGPSDVEKSAQIASLRLQSIIDDYDGSLQRAAEAGNRDNYNQLRRDQLNRIATDPQFNKNFAAIGEYLRQNQDLVGTKDPTFDKASSAYNILAGVVRALNQQQAEELGKQKVTGLQDANAIAEEFVKKIELLMKALGIADEQKSGFLLEQLGSAPNSQARLLLANKAIEDNVSAKPGQIDYSVVGETLKFKEEQFKQDEQAWAKHIAFLREELEEMFADIRDKSSADLAAIHLDEATGASSRRDAALRAAAVHQEQYRAAIEALDNEQAKGLNVDKQRAAVEAAHNARVVEDALATESAFDQMFDHIRKSAQNTSEKIAGIFEHALDGINDQIVNAIFGDKTDFKRVIDQSERSLAKVGLEWVEGSLLGSGKNKGKKLTDLSLSTHGTSLDVHVTGTDVSVGGSSGSTGTGSGGTVASSTTSWLKNIPGLTGFEDSIKNSTVGQWFAKNGAKYIPGVMTAAGGLGELFSGPQHTHGPGSGVRNALADAGYRENTLSRFLMGFGQIAKGAGSMMFAGAGGSAGFDSMLMNSNLSSSQADWLSNLFGNGPGFATGGDVTYGGVYPVGELGPEKVYLPGGSHVVPNKDLHGAPTIGYLDARGTDPVQTQMAVVRGMQVAYRSAVRDAQRSIIDRQRRTPR